MAGGKAFGEQNPSQGETAVSWQTWSDGDGDTPNIVGDTDWGKISLGLNDGVEGRSAVYDLGSATNRKFTLTENRYGSGSEDAVLEIRGDTASFLQDDASPDWEVYATPITRGWRYVQVRERTFEVYYVDATGGDDGGTGTVGDPWQTIAKVNASTFNPGDNVLFKRGETFATDTRLVCFNGVTYNAYGSGAKPILNGGAATGAISAIGKTNVSINNLDLRGGVGVCASLNGTYITMQDCEVSLGGTDGVDIYGLAANVHHVTLSRCTVHDNTTNGIYIGNSGSVTGGPTDVVVEDCTIYSNGTVATQHHGIYAQDGLRYTIRGNTSYSNISDGIGIKDHGSGSNSLVEKNTCYSNGHYGLSATNLNSGSNIIIRNNLSYSNTHTNLWIANATIGAVFYHNTLVNSAVNGLQVSATASGNLIKNNIIIQDASVVGNFRPYRFADDTCLAANTWDNNCVYYPNNTDSDKIAVRTTPGAGYTWAQWQALSGTPDVNGINDNPDFVTDYTDLHLQSTSPCRNIGEDLDVATDYDGVARDDTPDIGAYEYVEAYFFVDATGGDDEDTGTSAANAWQTISKVNSSSFDPGDHILFKRGETWRGESMAVPSSGTANAYVTFGAYGTGANPIIDPTTEFNDWVLDTGAIWRRAQTNASSLTQVFEDGVRMIFAANKAAMVAGSWAYDSGIPGYIHVWCSDSGNPNTGHVVEYDAVSLADLGTFRLNGKSYLVFDSIDIYRPGDCAFIAEDTVTPSTNVTIQNCNFSYCGGRSVLLGTNGATTWTYPTDVTVSNCVAHDDLDVPFWVGHCTRVIIEDCEAYDCGKDTDPYGKLYPNTKHYPNGILISAEAQDCIIRNNYVHDIYGIAILDERSGGLVGSNTIIDGNLVDETGYTFNCIQVHGDSTVIRNNITYNNNTGMGISLGGLSGLPIAPLICHNTFISASGDQTSVYISSGTDVVFKNNIVVRAGATNRYITVFAAMTTEFTGNNNLYYGASTGRWFWGPTEYTTFGTWQSNSGQDANGLNEDPDFVTPNTDLHLQSTSPARNAGEDLNVTTDYDGVARDDTPDIGAYEYVA